jgi:acetyl esterase/lipase
MPSFKEKAFNQVIVGVLGTADSLASKLGPRFARKLNVKIERDLSVPTWDKKTTRVDVYTPKGERPTTGWPVAFLIHGGGFRFFSKDSHATVAAKIAEQGYLTVAMDYRLTPEFQFPYGLIDVLSVYEWASREIGNLGGNFRDLTLAGESAGANFALCISLIACGHAPLPMFPEKLGAFQWTIPQKLILHCGYHQVSGVDHNRDLTGISGIVKSRMRMIEKNYLPGFEQNPQKEDWGLADPLLILEKMIANGQKLSPEFSEVFIPVGDQDPVLTDSVRLSKALQALGGHEKLVIYPKAPHAFYAMSWQKQYGPIWKDIQSFLALPKK